MEADEGEYPPFLELCKFLSQEARILNGPSRMLRGGVESDSSANSNQHGKQRKLQAFATTATPAGKSKKKPPACYFCQEPHVVSKCAAFLKKSSEEKKSFATEQKLCFGCLGKSHGYAECRVKKPWLLKEGLEDKPKEVTVFKTGLKEEEDGYYGMAVMVEVSHSDDPDKVFKTCALLDTQADGCFVSEALAESLKLKQKPVQLELTTMGAKQLVSSSLISNLTIRGVSEKDGVVIKRLYTQPQIPVNSNSLPRAADLRRWSHLKPVMAGLPTDDDDVAVGLLIGNNCPELFVPRELAYAGDDRPYGMRTSIGWGVMGKRSGKAEGVSHCLATSVKELTMEKVCRAFDIGFDGEVSCSEKMSQDDLQFKKIAEASLTHRADGHYEMDLPMREEPQLMPDNRDVALRQLLGQRRRFKRDPEYLAKYHSFVSDMLTQGHAERVTEPGVAGQVNYTPQHGVTHPRKPGKIRVVSNFSAKKQGVAMNHKLLAGPDLTNNMVGLMCRFRENKVAFMCDVKGMFFQVGVSGKHRDYLRFLWFEDGDPDGEVLDYRMCVHPFGATSSPTCANHAFKQNAIDHKEEFGDDVATFIQRDFYVDDGLRSKRSPKEVAELFLKAHALCLKGGFYLHKFTCNSAEAISMVPEELVAANVKEQQLISHLLPTETSLGIRWDMEADAFLFVVQEVTKELTRRGLLSALCSIYDPMGLIAPVILIGRLILQSLCAAGADWDEPIPEECQQRWSAWYNSLSELRHVPIPRCFLNNIPDQPTSAQMHHFCDASTVGYGACSYVRLSDDAGNVDIQLICAKARVAPKKATTMPRMELQAAVLASKMAAFLKEEMPYEKATHHFWSDSQVVLGYIRNSSRRFHLYVANRVAHIRAITEVEKWNYIRTDDNPADMTSRGLDVADISDCDLWWHGPRLLQDSNWPDSLDNTTSDEIADTDPEVKPDNVTVHKTLITESGSFLSAFERCSRWEQMITHVCIWHRYLRNLRICVAKKQSSTPPARWEPTVASRRAAEIAVLIALQASVFSDEKAILRQQSSDIDDRVQQSSRKRKLKQCSPLTSLDPFLDDTGVIRIGGRLRNASLSRDLIQPIVLPSKHHVVELLIRHQHELAEHPGRQATLARLRITGYWVLNGRTAVERYTRDCTICKRIRGTPIVQKMSELPEERLREEAPFTYCGMDLFGPFMVKHKRSLNKRWICVFVCFSSLAIHLEVVDELSTDSFLNAFRRFVGRRGPVRTLFSDRGTNFVGAANVLRTALHELDAEKIHREMLALQCDLVEFKFNSPKSSHMGGLWERAIRTIRSVLSSILIKHSQRMNEESFRTFVVETESITNSKPLTCLDLSDPTAEAPITPARLLTMKSGTALPPPGKFEEVDIYGYKRWRQVQALANLFWKQWRDELLPTFQARRKWVSKTPNLKVDDVVLLMDSSTPRSQWPLAKVEEVITSHDDMVRRVVVRCHGSTYERPVCKLIYLGSVER